MDTATVSSSGVRRSAGDGSGPSRNSSRVWTAVRNGAAALAVLVALYALLGFLILPTLAKPRLEAMATAELGRQATLGKLEFNPFTFRARLSDFALADREPQRWLVRFATLDLDVSVESLWRRAPVLDGVRLVRPQLEITRNVDGSYSIDDLVERAAAPAEGRALPFSVDNIEVDDGSVTLDDRPRRRKIVVTNLGIGIPFLSSFPRDATIRVAPRLAGALDGTRFALSGNSNSPFADRQDATLELDLDRLPLARYAEYVSLPGGTKITDGALTTRLRLAFVSEKRVTRGIFLSGTARVDSLALARKDGSRLAGLRSIDASLARLDWLGRFVALDRVVVDAPDAELRRDASGTPEIMRMFAGGAPAAPQQRASRWRYSVADARATGGSLRVVDDAVAPPFVMAVSNVRFAGRQVASSGPPGSVELSFDADGGAHFEMQGELDPGAPSMHGHFSLANLDVARLAPYYAAVLDADVRRGRLAVAGDFDAGASGGPPRFMLVNGSVGLSDVDAALPREREPFLRIARADIAGVALDAAKRSVTVDKVEWRQGTLRVRRLRDGTLDLQRVIRPSSMAARAPARGGSVDDSWTILVRSATAERIAADFEDRRPEVPVSLRIADARVAAQNMSSAPGAKVGLDVAARVGSKGRVRVRGTVAMDPLAGDWRIDATGIDLLPLRPYFEPRTNVIVTRGSLTAKGRVVYAAARSGPPRVTYKGDVTIGDFGSLDRPTSQELVRWKTLTLTGIDTTSEPLDVKIGTLAVDDFYARVILNADATLNLKQLVSPASAPEAAPAQAAATVAGVTTKELPPPAAQTALPLTIGRIALRHGEVEYSDFFVQPNYSAHLTDVAGAVSALSAAQSGTVEVTGSVDGSAPVDIRGTVNPFAAQLQLDLTGKATDIDLPPLTPYSVKYAGYGITKGKLSLEVHYRIDDRKLVASNKLRLDQLTFGERVDSPSATKLPVLLAVSLLKDRNGVINLDLPIQGTLDDPQFSVWRVVVQIFVSMITKAVTSPFALLASIGGGGGEQLSYLEFAPGRADLSPASIDKLRTLAKALNDRPGLKVDATGRAIAQTDRDGLKHVMLEQALRAQKQQALAAEGESAPPLDALTIDAAEYPKLLTAAYRAADLPDKPRNIFGIAKTIPPEAMEALLLASYRVDDQALAALANRRAQAVKAWMTSEGGVAPERVFVVAPRLTAAGIDDKGSPVRVDFAIR